MGIVNFSTDSVPSTSCAVVSIMFPVPPTRIDSETEISSKPAKRVAHIRVSVHKSMGAIVHEVG